MGDRGIRGDRLQGNKRIAELVYSVLEDRAESGDSVPKAISERQYRGKFQVRVTPELHRRLVIEAAEENVSLNRYLLYYTLAISWLLRKPH